MKLKKLSRVGASCQYLRLNQIEKKFKDVHQSSRSQSLIENIDKMLKYCSMRLMNLDGTDVPCVLSPVGRADDPPYKWRGSTFLCTFWAYCRSPIGEVCIHVGLGLVSIELIVCGLFSYEYHRNMKTYLDLTQRGLSGSRYLDSIEQKLYKLSDWIEFLGIPYGSLPAISEISLSFIGVGQLIFHQFSLMLFYQSRLKVRVDELGFLYNPIGERRRIMAEIKLVVRDFKLLVQCRGDADIGYDPIPPHSRSDFAQHEGDALEKLRPDMRNLEEVLKMIEMTNETADGDIEWPIVVTLRCYLYSLRFFTLSLEFSRALIVDFVVIITTLFIIFSDLQIRVQARLDRLNGKGNLTDIPKFHLDPMRLSPLDGYHVAIYQSHSSSSLHLLYIEAKYYFSWARAILMAEIVAVAIFVAHLAVSALYLVNATSINKIFWIKQIREQLDEAIESLKNRDHSWIVVNTVKAYLNYELFRRQHRPHRDMINKVLVQTSIFSVTNLAVCYAVIANLNLPSKRLVLLCATYLMVANSLVLIATCIKSKRIDALMSRINHLIAQLTDVETNVDPTKPQLAPLLNLWRRQVLTENDCRRFFASSVVEKYVTYDFFLSWTAYSIAFWLIIVQLPG